MKIESCPSYEKCSAPLCPLAPNVQDCKWFPDEPACKSRTHGAGLTFIIQQRKIQKKSGDNSKVFTFRMLNRNFPVRTGIVGINPNRDLGKLKMDEVKWIKDHPELTPEQIEQKRAQAAKMREKMSPAKDFSNMETV